MPVENIAALVEALRTRRIGGAAVDVYQDERAGRADALFELDNVIVTPHIGFKTREALERLSSATIENIGRYLRSDPTNQVPTR